MPTLDQWRATWGALGAVEPAGLFESLLAAYGEPQRRYHTARHLDECLAVFAEMRSQAERPAEIELALWFHDAIYDTRRKDNEERSARWARQAMVDAGLEEDVATRVHALVMATRHDAAPTQGDARILVDVDLAILGAEPHVFDEYERQVRAEYAWVPDALFRRERKKILRSFLDRQHIYNTAHFRDRREHRARENLRRSCDALQAQRTEALGWKDIVFYGAIAVLTLAALVAGLSQWIVVGAAVALSLLYAFLGPKPLVKSTAAARAGAAPIESKYSVSCTEDEVVVTYEGRVRERVRWDDIIMVGIRIDDSFLPQPWWIVGGSKGGCMFPSDARGWEVAHHEMSERLRGFDHQAMIQAAGMMSGGVVLWEKGRHDARDAGPRATAG